MPEPTKSFNLEVIPEGTEVSVIFTEKDYKRFTDLLLQGLPIKDMKHMATVLAEIKADKYTDPVTYHVHTVLDLLNRIEAAAKTAGKMVKKDYKVIDGKLVAQS
jgi:hypothetical protein